MNFMKPHCIFPFQCNNNKCSSIAYEQIYPRNDTEKVHLYDIFYMQIFLLMRLRFLNEKFHAHVSIHYCDDENFSITPDL
jgi:hypothetical protein